MTLRRLATPTDIDVTVYGRTKGYTPEEIGGGIIAGDVEVTFTNAEIAAAGWPGPPKRNDKMVIDGRLRNIEFVDPKFLGTSVLAFFCQVRG